MRMLFAAMHGSAIGMTRKRLGAQVNSAYRGAADSMTRCARRELVSA
jgi:hypothetical protein